MSDQKVLNYPSRMDLLMTFAPPTTTKHHHLQTYPFSSPTTPSSQNIKHFSKIPIIK